MASAAENRRRHAELLLPVLAGAVERSERLAAAGRLQDPVSRWELRHLQHELAKLEHEVAEPWLPQAHLYPGGMRFLWHRAEVARAEAARIRASARLTRLRSQELRRRRLRCLATG